jgi:hypothetical protein
VGPFPGFSMAWGMEKDGGGEGPCLGLKLIGLFRLEVISKCCEQARPWAQRKHPMNSSAVKIILDLTAARYQCIVTMI